MLEDVNPTFDAILCTVCVPVFNAPEYAENCIRSLLRSDDRVPILIVDDGSRVELGEKLKDLDPSRIRVITNQTNQGYTRSANRAIEAAETPFLILLNSDTEVPKRFAEKLIQPMLMDDTLAATGPLSNAASWQSVPKRFDHRGRWEVNTLPHKMTTEDMAELVSSLSSHAIPRVPLLNGFCLALRSSACKAIGLLDSDAFPTGYGEENDYCIRLKQAGFECAIVDNCWVFHAKSKSFGSIQKKWLMFRGGIRLNSKWGSQTIDAMIRTMRAQPDLARMRKAISDALTD